MFPSRPASPVLRFRLELAPLLEAAIPFELPLGKFPLLGFGLRAMSNFSGMIIGLESSGRVL